MGFTWREPDQFAEFMNNPNSITSVTVNFLEVNGVTRFFVEHDGCGEGRDWEETREWHNEAWEGELGCLKTALESSRDWLRLGIFLEIQADIMFECVKPMKKRNFQLDVFCNLFF